MSKQTSVSQTITVTICGKDFELSKQEAKKLRDQLNDAVNDQPIFIPVPGRERIVPMPYPVYPRLHDPYYDGRWDITCTADTGKFRSSPMLTTGGKI